MKPAGANHIGSEPVSLGHVAWADRWLARFAGASSHALATFTATGAAPMQRMLALAKEDVFIMDVSFSRSSSASALPILATRIIPLGDYWMTGGAALPSGSSAIAVAMKIRDNQELLSASVRESSLIPLAIIRASLECGMAQRIRYQDIPGKMEHHNGTRPSPPPRDILSRNSPCPCGSGKRYKRCCGE